MPKRIRDGMLRGHSDQRGSANSLERKQLHEEKN
jgi:hypothetical protein